MENYELLDEILPEIEIKETVSIDEILRDSPNYIIYTEYELLNLFISLIGKSKAKSFLKAHKQIVNKNEDSKFDNVTLFKIGVSRDDFTEAEIKNPVAPTYLLLQNELDKKAVPFHIDEERNNIIISNKSLDVIVDNELNDSSKILEKDNVDYPIIAGKWIKPRLLSEYYVNEKGIYYKTTEKESEFIDISETYTRDDNINVWIKNIILPKLSKVIDNMNELLDKHSLEVYLAENGYNFDEMTERELNELQNKLEILLTQYSKDSIKKIIHNKDLIRLKDNIFNTKFASFWETLNKHNEKIANFYSNEKNLEIFKTFIESNTGILPLIQSDTTSYDFIKLLIQENENIDEIIEKYKLFLDTEEIKTIQLFVNNVIKHDAIKDVDFIEKQNELIKSIQFGLNKTNNLKDSIYFLSSYNDIHEIVEGYDTSQYDGNAFAQNDNMFDETTMDEYITTDIDEINDYTSVLEINKPYSEFLDLVESEGIKEILKFVLNNLYIIDNASGLHFDYENLIKYISSYIDNIPKHIQLKLKVPDLSQQISLRICALEYKDAIELMTNMSNIKLMENVKIEYTKIQKIFYSDCENIFIHCIAWILIDLLKKSIDKTLQFNIFEGMYKYINLWSNYGPPLEIKSKTGIIFYLTEIIKEILDINIYDKLNDKLKDVFNIEVLELQKKWSKIKDERKLSEKEIVATKIVQSIKHLKATQGKDVKQFTDAFLRLPALLPFNNKKIVNTWSQGCCLSILDEHYEADNDWKVEFKQVKEIKTKLAEKRWLTNKRQRNAITMKEEKLELNINKVYDIINIKEPFEDLNYKNKTLEDIDLILPQNEVDNINNGELDEIITKLIKSKFKVKASSNLIGLISSIKKEIVLTNVTNIVVKILYYNQKIATNKENIEYIIKIKKIINDNYDFNFKLYLLTRLICLIDINYNANISPILDEINTSIIKFFALNKQITKEDVDNYINTIRESQKHTTLKVYNSLTDEERVLLTDYKKLGLDSMQNILDTFGKEENEEKVQEITTDENENLTNVVIEKEELEEENDLDIQFSNTGDENNDDENL